jgi:hypothetical protein
MTAFGQRCGAASLSSTTSSSSSSGIGAVLSPPATGLPTQLLLQPARGGRVISVGAGSAAPPPRRHLLLAGSGALGEVGNRRICSSSPHPLPSPPLPVGASPLPPSPIAALVWPKQCMHSFWQGRREHGIQPRVQAAVAC